MALTQQFARVSPSYLEDCRRRAVESPTDDPGWDPPEADRLDLNWDAWPLPALFRRAGNSGTSVAAITRALEGDPGGDVAFLDHDGVYDGFGEPPALLPPAAVAEIAVALAAVDSDTIPAAIPATAEEAAALFRFPLGDIAHLMAGNLLVPLLTRALTRLRVFYEDARRRDLAVVVWVD
ncbi:DUF1877 domain-containing protein [Embleya sp. AB8]|uniref:DUF1877 domain-containing protein n=1 Tax=Embleya sp. AB8 TaxID=3156304 RepID=UPI003C76744B